MQKWLAIVAIFCSPVLLHSQNDVSTPYIEVNYTDYMQMVLNKNLGLAAEKFNLQIASAELEAARIFQNPSLAVDWGKSTENNVLTGFSATAEISKSISLSNKRSHRIDLASSEYSLSSALLDDYLRNLQADATLDYINALKQLFLHKVMLNSYQSMMELSKADSIRLSTGSIMAIDALQSKIEAEALYNDLLQIEVDRQNAMMALSVKTSVYLADTVLLPSGNFENYKRIFSSEELITTALNNRTDLQAAKINVLVYQNNLALTRSERKADVELRAGTSNAYLNSSVFSPQSNEVYAGITIPLQFSNFNKGPINLAQFQVTQAELQYKQAEIVIQNEVIQAYNQYESLCKQVDNYSNGLLDQSKAVLTGKMYSYSRGETSLLEVLIAQRTYNDLQISYYETIFNCFVALVELEKAVGIWDISL